MGKLSESLRTMFGMGFREFENRNTDVINVARTRILRGSDDRVAFSIINLGANDAYVGLGEDVSATNGIVLSALGGSIAMNYKEDFSLVGRDWWGVAPLGVVNIYCIEVEGT